ncbi:MAG: rod shape-determining protein MreC [Candidatus Limimorpha sp.]
MYNLIRFIQKHFSVILFLIIEVGCVILLASSLGFHRQVIFNVTNDAVGWVYEIGSDVGDYFRLKKTNKQLAEENAKLRERLAYGTDTCNEELHVSDSNCIYKFIPAKVVNNSISQTNNYITINKGRTDGVEKDMGVISTDGIVGIVADVSRHYATIISLLHNYSVTSVRFKDNQHLANLRWKTNNFRYGTVEDIPTHLVLNKGDTVVTSSFSYVFPEDMMVGTIEEVLVSPAGDLNQAKIKFATNFSTLRWVYVIQNTNKKEIDSLTFRLPEP